MTHREVAFEWKLFYIMCYSAGQIFSVFLQLLAVQLVERISCVQAEKSFIIANSERFAECLDGENNSAFLAAAELLFGSQFEKILSFSDGTNHQALYASS